MTLYIALVDFEPEISGYSAVKHAQGIREIDAGQPFDPGAFCDVVSGRRPFAHAVDREDRGFVEPGIIIGTCRMRQMVIDELDRTVMAGNKSDFFFRVRP